MPKNTCETAKFLGLHSIPLALTFRKFQLISVKTKIAPNTLIVRFAEN